MFNTEKCTLLFLLITSLFICSCSNRLIPEKPNLAHTSFNLDSTPTSVINVPVKLNMRPFYQMAEKNVATTFTSPNWPEDWVTIDCANRYKYQFRRSNLQFNTVGNSMNIGFTGYYKIIGSTRACVGGAVISPWTPPCKCGFDEGERKVNVGFKNAVNVTPDYKIKLMIERMEPVPIDKCTVCFFSADITNQVMKGLKEELDLAKKAIEDSFGVVDLKPRVQQLWNKLNTSYDLYGLGWLKINPQQLRLIDLSGKNDTLNLFLGMSAKPVISFEKNTDYLTVVPDLNSSRSNPGFNLFLDAVLNYDSLSTLVNAQLKGKQFDLSKGKSKKLLIVKDCQLYGMGNEKLIIRLNFEGSKTGIAYFTGKPHYDLSKKMIEIREIDFDVKTKDLLLKSADWLFNKRIINEITNVSKFDLSGYIDSAKNIMNTQLNSEWFRGVKGTGRINELKIAGFYPFSEHLVIRSNASGELMITINPSELSLF